MNETSPVARRPATYADVLAAPPHMVAEVIAGALHLHPRPRARHALSASILGARLVEGAHGAREDGGGWTILDEPELHLGADILVPDIAGWRRETLPALEDVAHFTTRPDWVCEVLSPSTKEYDLTEKRAIYGREGVGHLWLVDPEARTLEVFRRTAEGWLLTAAHHGEESVALEPFDTVGIDLARLWL